MREMVQLVRMALMFVILLVITTTTQAKEENSAKKGSYLELRVYHFSNSRQEGIIDSFLKYNFIPAMHKNGIATIGAFKPIANDTAIDKRFYVLIPYASMKQWEKVSETSADIVAGTYKDVAYNEPSYNRFETIFLQAFTKMPEIGVSKLTGDKNERVYELRSYESASEKYFKSKVRMFNEGGEVALFARLGFNAVFYGEVLFGAKMPNLMYMTSFENMQARDEHWKAFGSDPEWKTLSGLKEYQNAVSHMDIAFLRSTDYSDL